MFLYGFLCDCGWIILSLLCFTRPCPRTWKFAIILRYLGARPDSLRGHYCELSVTNQSLRVLTWNEVSYSLYDIDDWTCRSGQFRMWRLSRCLGTHRSCVSFLRKPNSYPCAEIRLLRFTLASRIPVILAEMIVVILTWMSTHKRYGADMQHVSRMSACLFENGEFPLELYVPSILMSKQATHTLCTFSAPLVLSSN